MPCTLGFPRGAHSGAGGAGQEDAGLGALLAPACREAAKEPGSLCGQLLLTAPSGRAAGGRCCPAPSRSPAPSLRPGGLAQRSAGFSLQIPATSCASRAFFFLGGDPAFAAATAGAKLSPPGVPHEAAWCCAWLSWVLVVSPQRLGTAHPSVTRVPGESWLFFSLQRQSQQIKSKYPCPHANELWGTFASCPGTGILWDTARLCCTQLPVPRTRTLP